MAETVKIEIAIDAKDNTASGVSSAQRRLTSLEKSIEKTEKMLQKLGHGSFNATVGVNDNASNKIANIDDAVNKTNGLEAHVSVDTDDAATGVLNSISDTVAEVDGSGAVVDAEVNDAASDPLHGIEDTVAEVDGSSAVVDAEVNDAASGVLSSIADKADELDGKSVNINVNAVGDAAEHFAGNAAGASKSQLGSIAGVMGASFGVYDSVSTFAGFEAGMSQVAAISGATSAELDKLTEKAKYMGATTKFTATESAEAFNYMAMAGWKTEDMMNGIEGVMNLAAASGESLGSVSDIVTDAITAFGMKASDSTHFADVLAQASANANTNVGMLGESFKYVGPVAGAMGYSIEDTALALGLMANAGVKSSMSGTALRRAITSLAAPTDKQAAAMEKYGISLTDNDGRVKSLNEVMTDLRTNLGGLSEAEQTAAVTSMFGNQAMAGMLAIVNASADDWDKLSMAVNNADGASKRMADTMLDNLQGSFTLMQSAIEGVKDDLGEGLSPYFRGLADSITNAMPTASAAIQDVFTQLDEKVKAMTFSKEWTEADFFGKVDIAFDTIIAEPFREWAGGEGALAISDIVGRLFEEAFKILPGGEEAGLTSWLSAGVIALAGTKLAGLAGKIKSVSDALSGLEESGSILSTFGGALGTALPYIAGAAGALALLNLAVDAYNQKKIENDLAAHFGELKLTAEQAAEVANVILDAQWKVNVELALGELEKADQLRQDAEERLKSNEALEYKASVGVTLDANEQSDFKENVTKFAEDKVNELSERTFTAHLLVDTFLMETPEGQSLSSAINSWTLQDSLEMNGLSQQLKQSIDAALSDGILGVDEMQHIQELQQKMNSITEGWKKAESKAAMDLISQKYGEMSGEMLEAGSFEKVMESLHNQRQLNEEYLDQTSMEFFSMIEAFDSQGRLSEAGLSKDALMNQWNEAMRNERAKGLANSLNFERNTLGNAYAEEFGSWAENSKSKAGTIISQMENVLSEDGWVDVMDWNPENVMRNQKPNAGMEELYKQMLPDVSDMRDFIKGAFDENGEQVRAIPQEIMDSYAHAMEIGAASGDADAAMQLMANEIVKTGNEKLIEAAMQNDEMKEAMQIAMAETDGALTLDDVTVSLGEVEAAEDSASKVAQAVSDLCQSLSDSGSSAEVTADGVKIHIGDVEVDGQSAAEHVAESLGMTIEELADTAGVDVGTIEAGNVDITIPADAINTEGIDAAAAAEAAKGEVEEQVQEEFSEPIDTEGQVQAELDEENNAADVYEEVSGQVRDQFSSTIEASGSVAVTLDWHITNPTASISVGVSGGSATATIASAGMANGGFVDGAMLSLIGEDGPEYVIPVGGKRRTRGVELWAKAGEALGMFDNVPAYADGGVVGGNEDPMLVNPFTQYKSPLTASKGLLGAVASSKQGSAGTGVNVNVAMSPVIQIDGSNMNEEGIFNVMKNRIREVADDIGDEIGTKLTEIFGNMPLAGEA